MSKSEVQFERDYNSRHENIGKISYYDDETKCFYDASFEVFGHSYLIFYNYNGNEYKVKTIMNENNEVYFEAKDIGSSFRIIISGTIFFGTKSQADVLEKYYLNLNEELKQRRINFAKEITISVNNILEDYNIIDLIDNYICELSSLLFLNPELIGGIEYMLERNSNIGKYLFITDEKYRKTLIEEKQNGIDIKNENIINNYLDNYLYLFKSVLSKRIEFENDDYALYTAYLSIHIRSIKYYANVWENEYGKYFIDIENISAKDAILKYFCIDTIQHLNIDNAGMLVCYLIDNNKFDTNDYIKCYNIVVNNILKLSEDKRVLDFEKKLMMKKIKDTYDINDVDLMNGYEFEKFICLLFTKMGFDCEVTKSSGDQGIDIVAKKDNIKIGIQAKCYSNKVTNSAIQEVVAGIKYYNCNKALVVTNNYFTSSAIELAQINNVILWNRDILKEKIDDFLE